MVEAQREMRDANPHGAPPLAARSVLWLVSACCASRTTLQAGAFVLFVGEELLFASTALTLTSRRSRTRINAANPLRAFAVQVALAAALTMPLAGIALLYHPRWFYPAFMLITGAYYPPLAFIYGRKVFLALAVVLIGGGVAIAYIPHAPTTLGAWFTAAVLGLFAVSRVHPTFVTAEI